MPFFKACPIFLTASSTLYGVFGIKPELESNLQIIFVGLAVIIGHSTSPIRTWFSQLFELNELPLI